MDVSNPKGERIVELNEVLRIATAIADLDLCPTPNRAAEPELAYPDKVFVRTVTHYYVGRILHVDAEWIVLDDASWVASTGRWSNALRTGTLDEVEPFPRPAWIARGAVVDLTAWDHDLPRQVQ